MAETLKVLRRRIRSIKATKQVTRAMEMVSAAKLRRAQSVLMAGRPYAAKLQELLAGLAGSATVASHPLFQPREEKRVTLLVFTADRGLCGGFNANVIKLVENTLKGDPTKKWELFCVGKKGYDYFRRREWPIVDKITGVTGKPDLKLAQSLADRMRDRFLSGETDAVYIVYSAFVTMAVYRPTLAKFLSLDAAELTKLPAWALKKGEAAKSAAPARELDYLLEPSPEKVFNALLPRFMASKLYITLAEVMTSEHSARMLSMNAATKNCNELVDSLTLRMNKARQAQITKDLIDIVSGAQAIQG